MKQEIIKTMRRAETYDLHLERWHQNGQPPLWVEAYRSKAGHYIMVRHNARTPWLIKFIDEMAISPGLANQNHNTCSVGKSAKDSKWYGWSHRAMVGFGLGDRIFDERYNEGKLCESCKQCKPCEGKPCPSSIPFVQHGHKTIKADKDAKLAAVRFARSVS